MYTYIIVNPHDGRVEVGVKSKQRLDIPKLYSNWKAVLANNLIITLDHDEIDTLVTSEGEWVSINGTISSTPFLFRQFVQYLRDNYTTITFTVVFGSVNIMGAIYA